MSDESSEITELEVNNPLLDRLNMFTGLFKRARLGWKLLLDGRVPWYHKVIPVAAVAYIVSPLDLIPELITGPFGIIDDFMLLVLALDAFLKVVPGGLVEEHARSLGLLPAGETVTVEALPEPPAE